VVKINDILDSIKLRMRDFPQETRIRELYDRTYAAYRTDGTHGIKMQLDSDWSRLKTKFDTAIETVKRETGIV